MADYKTDGALGFQVHKHLTELGLETPMSESVIQSPMDPDIIEYSFKRIMISALKLNINDSSLKGTPKRVAKMFCEEIFYGLDYNNFPQCTTFPNHMKMNELVAVRTSLYSNCEHHFLPFVGEVWCGYIPDKVVLGTSKFNRLVDFFARRPQVQERLTEQIHSALTFILGHSDVAVFVRAEHFCAKIRGVKDHYGNMVTSKVTGKFKDVPELRQEFLALTRTNGGQ